MDLIALLTFLFLLLHRVLRAFLELGLSDVLRAQRIAKAILRDNNRIKIFHENNWKLNFLLDRDCDPLRTRHGHSLKQL